MLKLLIQDSNQKISYMMEVLPHGCLGWAKQMVEMEVCANLSRRTEVYYLSVQYNITY
jgi:hypothetical protein